jgi:DNA mismatch repair ATPase MutS
MAYFSLLYESEQKEQMTIEYSRQQLLIDERSDNLTGFELVGNRMVPISEKVGVERKRVPAFFYDLNLDQIINRIILKDEESELEQVFYRLLPDWDSIWFRQSIFRDLDVPGIYDSILTFYNRITSVHQLLDYVVQSNHPLQKSKYILDALEQYHLGIDSLIKETEGKVGSVGLQSMLTYLKQYASSKQYGKRGELTSNYQERIESIHYSMQISPGKIVLDFNEQGDNYTKTVLESFQSNCSMSNESSCFRQVALSDLEIRIADIIYKRDKHFFNECIDFTEGNLRFVDDSITQIHNELRFYLRCHDYFEAVTSKGYGVAYPRVSDENSFEIRSLYNIALAGGSEENARVVTNNFVLRESSTGAWITGANQGGKTTFARSIGQIVYLALLGLPVPASSAKIPLFRGIFTHFSKEENAETNNGKLKEELLQIREKLGSMLGGRNLFILNELFSSTTTLDAYDMSQSLIERLESMHCTVLCVTHIPKLAKDRTNMISLGTDIEDDEEHTRTYRIIEKEPEPTAHAYDIAKKYQLTFEQIIGRMRNEM